MGIIFFYTILFLPELVLVFGITWLFNLIFAKKIRKTPLYVSLLFLLGILLTIFNARFWNPWLLLERGAGTPNYLFINRGYPVPYIAISNHWQSLPFVYYQSWNSMFNSFIYLPLFILDCFIMSSLIYCFLIFLVRRKQK